MKSTLPPGRLELEGRSEPPAATDVSSRHRPYLLPKFLTASLERTLISLAVKRSIENGVLTNTAERGIVTPFSRGCLNINPSRMVVKGPLRGPETFQRSSLIIANTQSAQSTAKIPAPISNAITIVLIPVPHVISPNAAAKILHALIFKDRSLIRASPGAERVVRPPQILRYR